MAVRCQVIYSQFGLAIHQNDHQARRRFIEWAQNEIVVVPDFYKRNLFSDEAHFWLNSYVNKQNCRIWSEANQQEYVETLLHPEKLTVWCALWAGGIIGPYFFKNDEGHNVTVNGDRYRAMITNFFIPELNNHDVQELWFQQDGATCRIKAFETSDLQCPDGSPFFHSPKVAGVIRSEMSCCRMTRLLDKFKMPQVIYADTSFDLIKNPEHEYLLTTVPSSKETTEMMFNLILFSQLSGVSDNEYDFLSLVGMEKNISWKNISIPLKQTFSNDSSMTCDGYYDKVVEMLRDETKDKAMRCIGQGLESLKTFCAVMSLPNPVEQKSHDVINNKLSRVMKEVAEESMKMAAVEEYSSSPENLLTVSGDGTWKTRGHSSLIGVCTV
ncbi:uncharacterized protein TNCV_3385601 [Trichonephila clavipes]|uniref:Mutator-like transposase domain-containing protein n=1 Tax=Trichonephila clavipes TaxID=2585209 RepID=A0A8X6VQY0_TRICX|nr:uncharacterized protein TNCV_3385601 [Trichonephila clavipes]